MRTMQKKKTIKLPAVSWKRMLAFLIDYLILSTFILFPFNRLMDSFLGDGNFQEIIAVVSSSGSLLPLIYIAVLMSAITVIYFVVLEHKFNQTIGKMILNIEIEGLTKQISLGQTIIRSLSMLFLFTIPIIVLIDAVYAYFNKDGQRFFEKLSQTRTIMVAKI